MKKITLLFALALSSSLMFGQIVLTEDFEAGLTVPAGWTNNDIAGGGEVWTFDNTGDAVGYNSPNTILYVNGELEGNYAIFDSDGYGGSIAENSSLESPVFDCSGLTSVTLSFNHFFTAGFGGQGFVEVTTDGITWSQVASYAGVDQDDSSFGFESIDVSSELAGETTAQVRFRWLGDFAWGWAFDNVSVFQCTVSAPNAVSAVSPANGATGVEINYGDPNNLGPIEWAPSATGDAADSYNISLGTDPAGSNIGSISGFAIGNSINFDWQPSTTYFWFIEAVNCAGSAASPVFSFTTEACTELAVPAAATTPGPADAAANVSVQAPDASVSFNWTAANPDDNFILNLGTANPPTQSFNNFENGGIITGLDVNTTYFWSVDVVNCFGTTTGTVWSFTTDAALSINDNVENTFSVYPNPTSNILNIKGSENIDTITVLNLLGQSIASFTKNDITNSSINLSELSTGLYLVKISSGDKTQTLRVTKK